MSSPTHRRRGVGMSLQGSTGRRPQWAVAALIVLCSFIGTAAAEPTGPGPTLQEMEDLKLRIEELEAKERERDLERESDPAPNLVTPADWPWPPLTLGIFASVDYLYTDQRERGSGNGDANHFALGELDLFLVSQLSDHFSFLGELVFEFDSDDDTRIDVERLLIKYEHSDLLSVSVGRGHTSIGYWNRAYQHGTFLWTTVSRPLIFEFEDGGGILPMHFVGIEASGRFETPIGLFKYTTTVSNGRGRTPDAIQLTDDLNDSKMVALELVWLPSAVPDLAVGANFVYDDIPSDPGVRGKLDEYIAGGYVVYTGRPLEIHVEGQYIRHEAGSSYNSLGGYAQISYKIGDWTPYYRFDLLEVDGDDPFYAELPEAIDTRQHSLGVRFDWTSFLALKLEYQRVDSTGRNANVAAAQAALRF
jgi:hypothetical protein